MTLVGIVTGLARGREVVELETALQRLDDEKKRGW
jgi:hypothetical protein